MYTLDTNAVIYYAHGDEHAAWVLDPIFREHAPLYVATISEIELFGFPSINDEEMERIEHFLRAVTIIPLDSRIARIAASLRRDYRVKTLDSAIAATALMTYSSLITRNVRDFSRIPGLSIVKV